MQRQGATTGNNVPESEVHDIQNESSDGDPSENATHPPPVQLLSEDVDVNNDQFGENTLDKSNYQEFHAQSKNNRDDRVVNPDAIKGDTEQERAQIIATYFSHSTPTDLITATHVMDTLKGYRFSMRSTANKSLVEHQYVGGEKEFGAYNQA